MLLTPRTRVEDDVATLAPLIDSTRARLPGSLRRHIFSLSAFLLAEIAVVRIVSTYHVFGQIFDEPAHIAAGMEWLDNGTYTYEYLYPPFARVAVALGPFLSGLRNGGYMAGGTRIGAPRDQRQSPPLASVSRRYNRTRNLPRVVKSSTGPGIRSCMHGINTCINLTLARLGLVPFFLVLCWVVFAWAQRLFGRARHDLPTFRPLVRNEPTTALAFLGWRPMSRLRRLVDQFDCTIFRHLPEQRPNYASTDVPQLGGCLARQLQSSFVQ